MKISIIIKGGIVKNILIISENFLNGGLETNILSQVKYLKSNYNINFHLICENFYDTKDLPFKNIFNLKLGANLYSIDFINSVEKIVEYIKKHKIELIHIHPFYSLFPACVAASISKIPCFYTIHGPSSLSSFENSLNGQILNKTFLSKGIDKLLVVAEYLKSDALTYSNEVEVIENSINTEVFNENIIQHNKSWALISRLDREKSLPIIALIKLINKLPIKKLDIYGDGTEYNSIKSIIDKLKVSHIVALKGSSDNISASIYNKYNGVIGMGRVCIESMSMNLPTILMSYDGIVSAISQENFFQYASTNFSARGFDILNLDDIINEFNNIYKNEKKFLLRKLVINNLSDKAIWEKYLKLLKNIRYTERKEIEEVYSLIKSLHSKIPIYSNDELNNKLLLIENNFIYSFKYMINKILINQETNINYATDYFSDSKNRLNNEIDELKIQLSERDKIINSIYNSVSFKLTKPLRLIKKMITSTKKNNNIEIICVMCVYNEELNIEMCIKHLYDYVDKFVILDDGSTDSTADIISKFPKVIKIIRNMEEKTELYNEKDNRERLLKETYEASESKEPWVLCVDPDERFKIKLLKNLRKITNKYKIKTLSCQ